MNEPSGFMSTFDFNIWATGFISLFDLNIWPLGGSNSSDSGGAAMVIPIKANKMICNV